MIFQPVIKWSGSKRSQSEKIIKKFPKEIKTYYEPFVGGGSILFQLMNSDIKVEKYICSDINEDLIKLWLMVKNNPNKLSDEYEKMWIELNSFNDIEDKKKYYYYIRDRFNKDKQTKDFMFLTRTCVNGLIRFNLKGEFNSPFHFSRPGINPKRLRKIILLWSEFLNKNNVEFICQDYKEIKPSQGDLIYLDPPYANTTGMYYGTIDYNELWDFLLGQEASYILSFDGKTNNRDNTYGVPKEIYDTHEYIYSGISGFGKIKQKKEYVSESLYIKL